MAGENENQDTQTFTKQQLDEAVKAATAERDRFVSKVQVGDDLPKWAKDAGFKSRDEVLALRGQGGHERRETPNEDRGPKEPVFDRKPFLDEDGNMRPDKRVAYDDAYEKHLRAVTRYEADMAAQERAEADRIAAEQRYIQRAGSSLPEHLRAEDDERLASAMIGGLVSSFTEDTASEEQVVAAQKQFTEYVERAAERLIKARAAREAEERNAAPPTGRTGTGDGPPRNTRADELPPTATMRDRKAVGMKKSEEAFLASMEKR